MAQTIKLKRSSVSGNTPSTSDLELGEVAINTYDGKMFIKKNDGSDAIVEIGGGSGTVTEAFKTISVSGQSDVVADSATDTLTLVAGSNMTLTTNASGDTITFASSGGGGSQNLFSTFAVSGQNNVVADSTTDTLTFVAGTGITLTTDATNDQITIANSATGANAFGNIAVSGQTTVAADSTNDTLTLVGGTGISVTTDASTDTVTITNSSTAGNSFGTIAVSGQGSVVADQANDTLTLVAGSNVTLTTSAAGDSVTIASSGSGSSSVDAGASITEFKYDVSSSTTSFSGSDANSNTLAYTAGALQVYLNGILLDPATDYTATNGTAIVLTDAAVSGDDLQIIAFNRKILNANTTVNTFTGDGSTTAFTLSTDPVNENNTNVFIDGVYQSKSNYSVSGTTLTFSSAPPNTSGIEVSLGFQQAAISSTLDFDDNAILRIGTGNDLQLLHDGSNSIIKDTGTGDLQIGASTLDIKNSSLNETMIKAIEDGAVELYHNNAKKLETVTSGVTVTGTVTATTFSGDLSGTVNTATTGTTQSASDNSTKLATTAYVDSAVTTLVDSAPGTLDTLNELAAALGDDANFSTTITNSLATKVGLTATTGAANMPAGTTAQRPGSPAAGQFRYNSTLSQFEGYTSSWGAIGGGGTNTFTTDIFTANGSTTAFTLSQSVSSPNDCIVHIDGIYQTPTDAYTVSGTTLTFSSAPANTRKIVVYSVKAGVSGNNLNIQTFSGDGSATSFTMSINPINENNTIVHIDGVYQQKSSYSTSGTTLSFSAAPANGTTIEVATFTQTEINVPVNNTIDTVHIKDSAVTSAKLGGNLTLPGNLNFADSNKAIFGAGSDLQIYHNGSHSYVSDQGTGDLRILAGDFRIRNAADDETMMQANADGDVSLWYNNSKKLATTNTGINVTGTAVTDGLTVDGNVSVVSALPRIILEENDATDLNTAIRNNGGVFKIQTVNDAANSFTNRMDINHSSGDISFYEDTGTTPKLFWDASAESLGIGTSSPTRALSVFGDTAGVISITSNSTDGISSLAFGDTADDNAGRVNYLNASDAMLFYTATSERMRIDSSGNVSIGATSATARLEVTGAFGFASGANSLATTVSKAAARIRGSSDASTSLFFGSLTNDAEQYIQSSNGAGSAADDLALNPYGGNVGIGISSPNALLHVGGTAETQGSQANPAIQIGSTSGYRLGMYTDAEGGYIENKNGDNGLIFRVKTAGEAMRIDGGSGSVMVGKTTAAIATEGTFIGGGGVAGLVEITRDNNRPLRINRTSSDGQLVRFDKDGTNVGNIGTISNGLYIASPVSSDSGLRFSGSTVHPCTTTGAPRDNAVDLGYAQGRFDDIYATNDLINTSDRNEKQDIAELTDAEQRVAVAAKGLLRKFRWISSVEENGDDARIHFGIIAQDLQDAFTAEGLDAGRYAMFINSTWTDEETGEERSRMGVRYSELLAFIISAI